VDLTEPLNIHFEPELENPSLIAVWPGMGGVASIAAKYFKDELKAQEFGRIEPYQFFEPTAVRIRDNVIEEPQFPQSSFYFWKGNTGQDLIIFMGDAQPSMQGHALGNLILDVAQRFGVKRVYTSAAAPAHIHYALRPRILGVVTKPDLVPEIEAQHVKLMSTGTISGMNGILLGIAKKRDMEGICLLGEIPIYLTEMANPRASKAIVEVLSRMLEIKVDTTQMDEWIKDMDSEIEKNMVRFMSSLRENAKRFVEYLDRLKERADSEEVATTQELPEYSEELVKEVERFLKEGQAGKDEDIG
jgi:proteasome assembly chaperone (PAC2) family protein